MSSKENNILKAMELAIKFISKLDEGQLEELIKKNLIFTLEYKNNKNNKKKEQKKDVVGINSKSNVQAKKKNKKKRELTKEDFDEIKTELNKFSNREEAINYIKSIKPNLTKDDLIFIGQQLGITISKNKNKDPIINIIVEETVGNKLKVESIRKAIMGKEEEKI